MDNKPTSDQLLRALIHELRKQTAAISSLATALNGMLGQALSEKNAPEDAEIELPKKPVYLCDED